MRKHLLAGLALGILFVSQALGCKCLTTFPACNEVAQSGVVFIGTVESIEPAFLDPWNPSRQSLLPDDEIRRLRMEDTPSSLARLKEIYQKLYPNMPERYRQALISAKTHDELREVFDVLSSEGRHARLRVKTVFRHQDDDDDAKDRDKKKNGKKDDDDDDKLIGQILTIWTDAGDCGYDFQAGETYLVYADNDEQTGQLFTSRCYRTSRLSDAGEDLTYLYYYKNGGVRSTRLEGFVTSQRRLDRDRYIKSVDSPVPDVVVQMKSGQFLRYARADAGGRFIFDGLAAGDYELSVFDPEYPRNVRRLGYPAMFHAKEKSCIQQILTVPKQ